MVSTLLLLLLLGGETEACFTTDPKFIGAARSGLKQKSGFFELMFFFVFLPLSIFTVDTDDGGKDKRHDQGKGLGGKERTTESQQSQE